MSTWALDSSGQSPELIVMLPAGHRMQARSPVHAAFTRARRDDGAGLESSRGFTAWPGGDYAIVLGNL